MYRTIQQSLLARIQAILLAKYDITLTQLAVEQPPSIALGELALPVAFDLAKRLRKAPRAIATELAAELTAALPELEGVASVEVAGAGYLNIRLDRTAAVRRIAADQHADIGGPGFRLVEHTSINPNKAAHIGHLRNAILGDTFQRLLRPDNYKRGYEVGVQNYIDNTGVQVADVVVGLVHLEGKNLEDTRALLDELLETNTRIDYYCWDLYARVSQWYMATTDAADLAARKQLRLDTLHALEAGGNDTAKIADLVATAVLRRHLQTMERIGIEYDFLPRESEILTLHFWDAARTLMMERGVLYLERTGKNAGCYVMRRAGADAQAEGNEVPDEDAKVIVRSNGTVTYVGKDIAYHLWKFGLLPGKDFGYSRFHEYPTHTCWISTAGPVTEPQPPTFGKADAIYNVIDSRQNDPQTQVVQALRGMGFTEAADRYTHFSYEMVALTPRCALELGYTVSEEDQARSYIEVSGRKGFGVKADDLLDKLIAAAQSEVDSRHPQLGDRERLTIARQIAIGALRYFMLKYTKQSVIAFDFKEALSFEGETGPYAQYAVVRATSIFRKAGIDPDTFSRDVAGNVSAAFAQYLTGEAANEIWGLWLTAAKTSYIVDQCIATTEPAYLAKHAFQLAQFFNTFSHRHPILGEPDEARKQFLLSTVAVVRRELIRTLAAMGITVPRVM